MHCYLHATAHQRGFYDYKSTNVGQKHAYMSAPHLFITAEGSENQPMVCTGEKDDRNGWHLCRVLDWANGSSGTFRVLKQNLKGHDG